MPAEKEPGRSLVLVGDGPEQPKTGAGRAQTRGPRGCWALTKAGEPCRARPWADDADYCNAHAGRGIMIDPAASGEQGKVVRRERIHRRAELKLLIGSGRLDTPKAALRAAAVLEAEKLTERLIQIMLDPDPESRLKQGELILKAFEAVEPKHEASITVPLDANGVDGMGLSALMEFADRHGITAGQEANVPPTNPSQPA